MSFNLESNKDLAFSLSSGPQLLKDFTLGHNMVPM